MKRFSPNFLGSLWKRPNSQGHVKNYFKFSASTLFQTGTSPPCFL